jgi:L-iditol 2-dehydrogenase
MKGAAAGIPGKIQLIDFPEPIPGLGDVVLSTIACGVCTTDLKMVQKGTAKPEYALGHEVTGRIVQAGPESGWKVGQKVIAAPYLPCGACYYCQHNQPTLCSRLFETSIVPGGMAESILVPAEMARRGLIPLPEGLPEIYATLAEPLGCVVKGLEDARVQPGQSALVVGDGPMGVLAAAALRAYGCFPVMVAGMTPHRLAMAQEHFADIVIDVSREDAAECARRNTDGRGADVVFVAVSSPEALETGIRCVRPGGTVNAFAGVPDGTTIPLDIAGVHYKQYYLTGSFGTSPAHMSRALALLVHHKVDAGAVISAEFPFEKVDQAVEYAMERRGLKVVVTFN